MLRTSHTLASISHPSSNRPSYGVSFVLSGGAARGALQVGMLQVLIAHGIVPDFIVGTSVGAFNGAYLAGRPSSEGMRSLEDIWLGVRYDDVFSGGPVGVVMNLVKRQPSLYNGDGVRRLLQRAALAGGLNTPTFESLPVPLAVVATNLTRGRPAIFEHGPILPALLASSAIPAVLPPVELDGEQYVDGGLLDNVGLRVAASRAARRIYLLDTSWEGCAEKPATTLESVIDRSLQVVMAFHLQCALEAYATQAEVVVLRADVEVAGSGSDFSHTSDLIQAGRAVAERVLASPQRESERAIQRGRAALSASRVRGAASVAGRSGQHIRAWMDAAAVTAHAALGSYARQEARTFAPAASPNPLIHDGEAPQQAS